MNARLIPLAVGVVAWLAIAAGPGGGDRTPTLRVGLDNAAGLVTRDEVRMAGVVVGEVRALRVTPDTHVIAEVALRHGVGPVGPSARAEVRAANLFGGKYLALVPGPRRGPAGWTIPRKRTAAPVELDDVLDTLDADTRARLSVLLGEAGLGLTGRGTDLRTLLGALPETLDETSRLVADLATDNRALGRLVDDTATVVHGLAGQRRQIGGFVSVARTAAAGFAAERPALRATVREAPATLARLRDTLQRLERLAGPLGPTADLLARTAPPLDEVLARLPALERDATPALTAARRSTPKLRSLGRSAAPVLARALPTLTRSARVAAELAPVTRILREEAPPLIGVLQNWARATQLFDGLGHYFRAEFVPAAAEVPRAARKARGKRRRGAVETPRVATPAAPLPGRPTRPPRTPLPIPEIRLPGLPSPADVLRPGKDLTDRPAGALLDYLLGR